MAKGHRLFAFYRLAAYSGARRGELLNLRWRDVDLDGASIQIKGSASFIAGERIEGTTKSGRSRVVSIDPGTVDVLKAHRKRQLADKLKVGESWKGAEDEYVFTTGWGEPVHPDTVSSLMAALIKGHNGGEDVEPLPRARLHDLRHVHATTLLLAASPSTWWLLGSGTLTRPSRSGSTPTWSTSSLPKRLRSSLSVSTGRRRRCC